MKNKKKIAIISIVMVMIVAVLLGYTYSKYVQEVNLTTAKAAIANWNFSGDFAKNGNISKNISLLSTSDNPNDDRLAPGTKGSFDIIIDATGSEVGINYTVKSTSEESLPRNLKFTYAGKATGKSLDKMGELTGGSETEKYNTISDLINSVITTTSSDDSNEKISGTIEKNDENKVIKYTINWEWPYETKDGNLEENDKNDTEDSKLGDYNFVVNIKGEQKK